MKCRKCTSEMEVLYAYMFGKLRTSGYMMCRFCNTIYDRVIKKWYEMKEVV